MIPSDLQVAARKRNWKLCRLRQAVGTLAGYLPTADQRNAVALLNQAAREQIDKEWDAERDRILAREDRNLPPA